MRKKEYHPLSSQKLRRMLNMVIRKRSHRIITVIVIRLVPHIHALNASLRHSLFEVLGEKLALFVEVVAGSLRLLALSF